MTKLTYDRVDLTSNNAVNASKLLVSVSDTRTIQTALLEARAAYGGDLNFEFREITPAEATAKQLTLAIEPNSPMHTVVFVSGGTVQFHDTDYTVTDDILSWSGLGLEDIIVAGTKLVIFYPYSTSTPVGSGDITRVEYFTLGATEIAQKYVDLLTTPSNPYVVQVFIIGGSAQKKGDDWELITNGTSVRRVSWLSRNLDGQLVIGDELMVVYTLTTTNADEARNVQTDPLTPFGGHLAGATEVQAALDIIDDLPLMGGDSTKVEYFILDGTDISNQFVLLAEEPTIPESTMLFIKHGSAQFKGEDWDIMSDGSALRKIYWNGLGMQTHLAEGDELMIVYTTITGGGSSSASLSIGSVDISKAAYSGNPNFTLTSSGITGTYFSPDGLRMYVSDDNFNYLRQWDLGTAWDISTVSYVGNYGESTGVLNFRGIFLSPDGANAYRLDNSFVRQYTLGTSWQISTASALTDLDIFVQVGITARDLQFSSDGLKMYVMAGSTNSIHIYNLGTPWDISTAVYDTDFSHSVQTTNAYAFSFGLYGRHLFVAGSGTPCQIHQYDLTSPWDLSTATYYVSKSLLPSEARVDALNFDTDMTKMFSISAPTIISPPPHELVTYTTNFNLLFTEDVQTREFTGLLADKYTLQDALSVVDSVIGKELLLAQATSIDATAVAEHNLYTVPTGIKAVITKVMLRLVTATGLSGTLECGIGVTAGADDIITSTLLTGFNTTANVYKLEPTGNYRIASADEVVKIGIDTSFTGTTATLAIDLFGYLVV